MSNYTRASISRQSDSSLTPNSHRSPRRTLSYPQKVERAELRTALAHITSPAHGDRWGDWVLDAKRFTLTYEPVNSQGWWWEIDLERMVTPARMLDAIFQFRQQVWASRKAVGDLVEALDDLLDPQSTLCSWGQAKTLDATKHLQERTVIKVLPDLVNS